LSVAPELPLPRGPPALPAWERVDSGWVACGSAALVGAFLPAPFAGAAAGGLAAALDGLSSGTTLEERRTAGGGSSSPDGPDESLRKVGLRLELLAGGGIETAVETVGFGGASPVGVLARGIT
jgi:hypothetical protein